MDAAFKVWFLAFLRWLIRAADLATGMVAGWTFSNGSSQEKERARRDFNKSAQVVSVAAKASYVPDMPSPRNSEFIFRHKEYTDPRRVLLEERVVLSHMTKDSAFFGILPGGVDLYDTKQYPFHYLALYHTCQNYIVVPMSTFYRLAEEVGDPKKHLGVVAMTLRCGSTLLSQVMQRVANTRSLSEPYALDSIWFLFHNEEIDMEEVRQRLRATVRLLTKTTPDSANIERFFIKTNSFTSPLMGLLHELFPKAAFIASTRHPVPSVISFRKLMAVFSVSLYDRTGQLWRNYCVPTCVPVEEEYDDLRRTLNPWRANLTYDQNSGFVYASSLACIREYGHIFDLAVLYEDLIGSPEETVGKLFKVMKVGAEVPVSAGMAALGADSQKGIFKSVSTRTDLPPELSNKMNHFYRRYGFPIRTDSTVEEFRDFVNDICHKGKRRDK